jgi:hypothetical protein
LNTLSVSFEFTLFTDSIVTNTKSVETNESVLGGSINNSTNITAGGFSVHPAEG